MSEESKQAVVIDYTNWEGKRSERRILPIVVMYGNNEWHPEDQWLLVATDLDRGHRRTFAMSNIHSWRPA